MFQVLTPSASVMVRLSGFLAVVEKATVARVPSASVLAILTLLTLVEVTTVR